MKKRSRFIIVLICVIGFFVISPVLVLYSMGYRFDFEKMIITATGGIYVRSYPAPDQVIIDSKITQKPGLFSNSVFVQSLLPDEHTVLVQKTDYHDYYKTIPVEEKEVTKLENITLFKKDIQFDVVEDSTQSPFLSRDKFVIKNNNLYYSNVLENIGVTEAQRLTPVLKKVAAFAEQNGNIIWLGNDGFLYRSNASDFSAEPAKITLTPLEISDTGVYKIVSDSKNIFVNNDGNLLFLDTKTNELEYIYSPIKDVKISPDGESVIYHGDRNIYVSSVSDMPDIKNGLLYKSSEKINDFLWLNDYYIIFTAGNKITISETDYRGDVNTITLPQTIVVAPDKKIDVVKPEIFFDRQSGKLYILTGDNLLLSEKVIP